MAPVSNRKPPRASIFSPKPKTDAEKPALYAGESKRGWCCFGCPGEAPTRRSKAGKEMRHKPAPKKPALAPVSSGAGAAAPRIAPVPSFGPASEARAFPASDDALDFRHWR